MKWIENNCSALRRSNDDLIWSLRWEHTEETKNVWLLSVFDHANFYYSAVLKGLKPLKFCTIRIWLALLLAVVQRCNGTTDICWVEIKNDDNYYHYYYWFNQLIHCVVQNANQLFVVKNNFDWTFSNFQLLIWNFNSIQI